MSDKERIEKLLISLQYNNSMLDKLRRMVEHPCFNKGETVLVIREIIEANNYILDVNADQINIDL